MFFGQSSFGIHALATERNIVLDGDDVSLELLGPLGCGIQTDASAVINTLDPQAASSIVVFETGSAGLSAVMAADLKDYTDILAVDLIESRRGAALKLGATHAIDPDVVDNTVDAVHDHLGGGTDYNVETTANTTVLRQAVDCLRQNADCTVVGAPLLGTEVSLDLNNVLLGRNVKRVIEGNSTPDLFISDLIDLYRAGKFPFDELVTYYDFEEIERAVEEQEAGKVVKPVLRVTEP
ncbi:zinc-binding dehydrogenase [Halalkalicoccus subterraneus]|uniref:zinc-binding dehydrogenase n=1 Tax=Halalkalicoccus subterraneus TaxID=2675002 RepID=UPI001FEB16AE|nr:zinc-binding dehydrogenase [Halalkalicoccus subterraneus]